MSEKGLAVTRALLGIDASLIAQVVGARDSSVANDYSAEIASECAAHGVPFAFDTKGLAIATPFALAVSWRKLINAGEAKLVVLHDSLLPRYRGFNPLVTALINGDREIGVSALYASERYDCGDLLGQERISITYPITIAEAIAQLLPGYISLALNLARSLSAGIAPVATPQSIRGVSYSLWRDEKDYWIDWQRPAEELLRTIHALGAPYSGARTQLDSSAVVLDAAEVLADVAIANRTPGKVIFVEDGYPVVVCGVGLLKLTRLRFAENGQSALPLARFRSRFGSPKQ